MHREAFLKAGGGVLALAAAASSVEHYRLSPLPPRLADAWRRHCGVAYESSSLLLPAAIGLANLTKCGRGHPSVLCLCVAGCGGIIVSS